MHIGKAHVTLQRQMTQQQSMRWTPHSKRPTRHAARLAHQGRKRRSAPELVHTPLVHQVLQAGLPAVIPAPVVTLCGDDGLDLPSPVSSMQAEGISNEST